MASPLLKQQTIASFQKLPVREFNINGTHITGKGSGIDPILLFHVAKNPHDPIAQRLIDDMPEGSPHDQEIIRELCTQITPKDNMDIYAPSPELEGELDLYSTYVTEDEILRKDERIAKLARNCNTPEHMMPLSYVMLKDLEKGNVPLSIENEHYQPTAIILERDIIRAQVTQNDDKIEEFINMKNNPAIEQNEVEAIDEQQEGNKDTQRRLQLWNSVHVDLLRELKDSMIDRIGRIEVSYSLSYETAYRFGYEYDTHWGATPKKMSDLDGQPRKLLIRMQELDDGCFKINDISTTLGSVALAVTSDYSASILSSSRRLASLYISCANAPYATYIPPAEVKIQTRSEPTRAVAEGIDSVEVVYSSEDESEESYTFPSRLTEFEGSESYKVVLVSDKHSAIELPVDAMVCETDTELKNPHKGSISIDILKAAGKKVKEECKNKPAENSLEHGKKKCHPGGVIKTGSGDLIKKNGTTRVLMHTTTLPMDGGTRRHQYSYARTGMLLQTSYENILVTTSEHNNAITMSAGNENRIHSVFIPLLGTENGHTIHASVGYLSNAIQKHGRHLKDQGVMVVVGCRTAEEVTEVQNSIQRS